MVAVAVTVVDICGRNRFRSCSIFASLPLCSGSPALPVSSKRPHYRSTRLRAFQTIPRSQHAGFSSSLKPITCVNSFFKQNAATLRHMALARMLVIVSTIFIVTASLIVALSIARSTVYDFFIDRPYTNIFLLCHTIYLELGMVNSSGVNLFVYVLRSSRFRQELATFACFRFLKRKKGRTEERGCDCEHKDDRIVGCVQLRNTMEKAKYGV